MPLAKVLGLPGLTFYGVGIILGAGIFSVLGAAAAESGEALWISFALSGAVALVTALSYAELATAYPHASAEFSYLRRAFPKVPQMALVVGLLVAMSCAASATTVAIAFAGYLRAFVDVPPAPVALALLAATLVLNVYGAREASWVNAAFTVLEAGGLVVFIWLGLSADPESFAGALIARPTLGILPGAALVFFSFLGFENVANLAEDAANPRRDLSRAILLSLGISTLLYVLVALAAVALVPIDQLAGAEAPLADAASARSAKLAVALGVISLFATANTALASLLVASRVIFGIARDGELPRAVAAVLPSRKTPWVAVAAVTAIAAALVPFGSVATVASLSSFAALLAFAAVNVATIVLRYRDPTAERPFRLPLTVGRFPLLPALGAATTVGVALQLDREALVGGAMALAAATAWASWHHRRR